MGIWKSTKIFVRTKFSRSEYILHGVRIPIDRNIITNRILYSIIRGKYEYPESKTLKEKIKPDDRVLELGGGLGLISAIASKIITHGEVVCVEANPGMMDYIARVHALNAVQAKVINAVVSKPNSAQQLPFYLRENFWASSLSPVPDDYIERVNVPAMSIDQLVQQYRPTVIIIDIEGGEINLIQGNWHEHVRVIIMEVHPEVLGEKSVDEIVDFFVKAGFATSLDGALLLMQR